MLVIGPLPYDTSPKVQLSVPKKVQGFWAPTGNQQHNCKGTMTTPKFLIFWRWHPRCCHEPATMWYGSKSTALLSTRTEATAGIQGLHSKEATGLEM